MKKFEFEAGDWSCVVLYAGEPKYTNRYKLDFTEDYSLSEILNYARKLGEEEGFVPKFVVDQKRCFGCIVVGEPDNEKNQFIVALTHDAADIQDEDRENANEWLDNNTRVFESRRRPGRMLKESRADGVVSRIYNDMADVVESCEGLSFSTIAAIAREHAEEMKKKHPNRLTDSMWDDAADEVENCDGLSFSTIVGVLRSIAKDNAPMRESRRVKNGAEKDGYVVLIDGDRAGDWVYEDLKAAKNDAMNMLRDCEGDCVAEIVSTTDPTFRLGCVDGRWERL